MLIKLLESTHVSGLKAVERKYELQRDIEHQLLLGGTVLDEQDRYQLEINVGDLNTSSGEDQYYWLLAIQAALAGRRLKEMQVTSNAKEHARRRRA